ncbi:MAG: GTPase [Candidatus Hodarchaeales archaeon]|jgi:nucleolar GTP-binding protein
MNPFKACKPIHNSEKILQMAFDRAMRTSVKGTSSFVPIVLRTRRKEARRVEYCAQLLNRQLEDIVFSFPSLTRPNTHPFYLESIKLFYSLDDLRRDLGAIHQSTKVIWRVNKKQGSQIWHAKKGQHIKDLRRAAFGRYASIIQAHDRRLSVLEKVRIEISKLPDFNFDQLILCLAGYPNAGKSTFLSTITNASPEIGAFPFTTKQVMVGKYEKNVIRTGSQKSFVYLACQVVDTPGILDRPIEDKNDIEIRALTALKTLPDAVLFLFDPMDFSTFSGQVNLYREIKESLEPSSRVYCAINKADLKDREVFADFAQNLNDVLKTKVVEISAKDVAITGSFLDKILVNNLPSRG